MILCARILLDLAVAFAPMGIILLLLHYKMKEAKS